MITLRHSNNEHCLILTPNRSASWQGNKLLILVVAALGALISAGFAYIGAWVILPFAGMEILALSAALYWVNWDLNCRHVLWFDTGELRIEKGHQRPHQTWHWPRADTAIQVKEQPHPDDPLIITLSRGSARIRIGDFLSPDDSRQLLVALKSLGLRINSYSQDGNLTP